MTTTDLNSPEAALYFARNTVKNVEDHLQKLATTIAPAEDYVFYFSHGMAINNLAPDGAFGQGGVLYALPVRKGDKRQFRNGKGEIAKLIPHNDAIMKVIASQREFLAMMRGQLAELESKAA